VGTEAPAAAEASRSRCERPLWIASAAWICGLIFVWVSWSSAVSCVPSSSRRISGRLTANSGYFRMRSSYCLVWSPQCLVFSKRTFEDEESLDCHPPEDSWDCDIVWWRTCVRSCKLEVRKAHRTRYKFCMWRKRLVGEDTYRHTAQEYAPLGARTMESGFLGNSIEDNY